MPEERIDSHHHLWTYSPAEYPWIQPDMEAIRRDFRIDDLRRVMASNAIDGVVTVQVCQNLTETEWLLALAATTDCIRGVVGWLPLTEPKISTYLEKYSSRDKFKGVRHVLQDEADDSYMLREDFNRGIVALSDFGLRYDILIFERHLPQTIQFVDLHPNQVFILDHVAKPKIKRGGLLPWRQHIQELALRRNVYCKLSGMVTEADWKSWTEADLQPFIETVLECFGPKRLMFGSDWPVVLLASTYGRWVNLIEQISRALSPSERDRLWGGTAREAYGL